MPQLVLASACNEPYLPRMDRYLSTISSVTGFDRRVLYTLDFDAQADYRNRFPAFEFVRCDSREVPCPNPNFCLQHGGFLPSCDCAPDDVIVFTDGDIIAQRNVSPGERGEWLGLKPGEVCVGFNARPGETLAEEATYLHSHVTPERMHEMWEGNLHALRCFNTGVIVSRRDTYQRLLDMYSMLHDKVVATFAHYARQQWLLSYMMGKSGCFTVRDLSPISHSHGCHGLPQDVTYNGGFWTWRGGDILFAHNLDWIIGR